MSIKISPRLLGSRLAGLPFSWTWLPRRALYSLLPALSLARSLCLVGCVILWLWADGWMRAVWSARGGGRLGRHSRFLAVSSWSSLAWFLLLRDVTMAETAYFSRRLTDRGRGSPVAMFAETRILCGQLRTHASIVAHIRTGRSVSQC